MPTLEVRPFIFDGGNFPHQFMVMIKPEAQMGVA
jgi:hypothetical protein